VDHDKAYDQNYWVLDVAHRPVFQKLENTTFQKLDLFPSSGGKQNISEVGSVSSFGNVVFSDL
jgi:hypothetical protein